MTTTYTVTEAARALGVDPVFLLDFDQSITDGWEHEFTPAEIDDLRHALDTPDDKDPIDVVWPAYEPPAADA